MGCHTWFFRPIKEGEIAADHCSYSREKFNDDLYTDIDTPFDIFRIAGYPGTKLLSLQETINFIESNKDKMCFDEGWGKKLKEFWNKNPEGVIEFG